MRDFLAELPETKWRERHFIYVLVSFRTRDVFYTLSCLFVRPGIRLCFCLFDCSLFCRLLGFRELSEANFNGNGDEYNGCVRPSSDAELFMSRIYSSLDRPRLDFQLFCESAFLAHTTWEEDNRTLI